jgi:hypothetical protein
VPYLCLVVYPRMGAFSENGAGLYCPPLTFRPDSSPSFPTCIGASCLEYNSVFGAYWSPDQVVNFRDVGEFVNLIVVSLQSSYPSAFKWKTAPSILSTYSEKGHLHTSSRSHFPTSHPAPPFRRLDKRMDVVVRNVWIEGTTGPQNESTVGRQNLNRFPASIVDIRW